MEKLKSFISWLVVSSQDPKKVALTVQGFLMILVPFVVQFSGLLNLVVDEQNAKAFVDAVSILVQTSLTFVGSIVMVVGIIRKFIK